jgi:hypothetical protein
MAQRRMFSLKVVDTDAFCEMPTSAQNLYFHIGMRADDEGFYAGVKGLMAKIHASQDDLNVLIARAYLLDRGDGVYVVKHWKMNNYLQLDRIKETEYEEKRVGLYTKKDGSYTLDPNKADNKKSITKGNEPKCIQNVSIDKNSIEENRVVESSIEENKKEDKTRYNKIKAKSLCQALVSCGYILEDELNDTQWDTLLSSYVSEHGYTDTKIKLVYVLDKVCAFKTELDRDGRYVYRKAYEPIEHPIENKYLYLKSSMDKAFKKDNIDNNLIRVIANQFDFDE